LSACKLPAAGGSRAAGVADEREVNIKSRDCRRRVGITVTVNSRLNLRLGN